MTQVTFLQAVVYGVVQGLTEFLPISSTAHIRIVPTLFGWQDPGAAFTANIQLGTLAAVLIYFFGDLRSTLRGWMRGLRSKEARQEAEYRLGWSILLGTIPIVIFGFLFKDAIEKDLRSLTVVAGGLIGMALLLAISERVGKKERGLSTVTLKDGLVVGLFQAMALIPGCSRSGSTITGALFSGFDRATAARFSFLLSLPAILLAGLYTTYEHRAEFAAQATELLVANVVSLAVGYACIAWLMKLLQSKSTMGFVIYRVILGAAILAAIFSGQLDPFAGMGR